MGALYDRLSVVYSPLMNRVDNSLQQATTMASGPKPLSKTYRKNIERLRPLSIWLNDLVLSCDGGQFVKTSAKGAGEPEIAAFHKAYIENSIESAPSYSALRKLMQLTDDVGMPSADTLDRLAVGLAKAARKPVTGKTLFDLIKREHELSPEIGLVGEQPDSETIAAASILSLFESISQETRLDLAPKLLDFIADDMRFKQASHREKLAILIRRNSPKVNDPLGRLSELTNGVVSVARLKDLVACRKLVPGLTEAELEALAAVIRDYDRRQFVGKNWIKAGAAGA